MVYTRIELITVRSRWEDAITQVSAEFVSPVDFITTEDAALMMLLFYRWKIDGLLAELRNSPNDLFRDAGIGGLVETPESQCIRCLRALRTRNRSAPEQTNPLCGHLCDGHLKRYIEEEVNNRKYNIMCPHRFNESGNVCYVRYPMSFIPEPLLERYKQNIDANYLNHHIHCLFCPEYSTTILHGRTSEEMQFYICGQCNYRFRM